LNRGAIAGGRFHTRHTTPYRNTIPVDAQLPYPGKLDIEARITAIHRWNALVMVMRANLAHPELGGHIATYASIADLFEVGFQPLLSRAHCERIRATSFYFQPHAAPGVYARAYLEGRLDENRLMNFRREVSAGVGKGTVVLPAPDADAGFWQFPTGSMGLGLLTAIYQARFQRYLQHPRDHARQRAQGLGLRRRRRNGRAGIAGRNFARRARTARNLILVVNCNLQRLDGPVRGKRQHRPGTRKRCLPAPAGTSSNACGAATGTCSSRATGKADTPAHGRGRRRRVPEALGDRRAIQPRNTSSRLYPELAALVANLSDKEIDALMRGGHDPVKIHAAYAAAVAHRGQPTIILAQTTKGYGMGASGQGANTSHQTKKLARADMERFPRAFRAAAFRPGSR